MLQQHNHLANQGLFTMRTSFEQAAVLTVLFSATGTSSRELFKTVRVESIRSRSVSSLPLTGSVHQS